MDEGHHHSYLGKLAHAFAQSVRDQQLAPDQYPQVDLMASMVALHQSAGSDSAQSGFGLKLIFWSD